jgi:putative NIF3 family GTP cyclohydrolase 1 type 2
MERFLIEWVFVLMMSFIISHIIVFYFIVRVASSGWEQGGNNQEIDPWIKTLGICAGSGGQLLRNVEADAYLSGEMGHHDVLEAVGRGISVILCEHSNTERGYLTDVLQPLLQEKMGKDVRVGCSLFDQDPLQIQ